MPHVALAAYAGGLMHPGADVANDPRRPVRPTDGRGQPSVLVLRSEKPPVDQLDFDDRHDTRATESKELAERYAALRRDRRRSDWHYLAMNLVGFVVVAAVCLAGFVVLSRLLPHLNSRLAMQAVGLASVIAGGGVIVIIRPARRARRQRHAPPWDR
jgi:hypothetical protein